MKRRIAGILIAVACVFALFHGFAASAAERKYPESVYSLPPITVIRGGEIVEIKLCDVFDFHGNACPKLPFVTKRGGRPSSPARFHGRRDLFQEVCFYETSYCRLTPSRASSRCSMASPPRRRS